MSTTVHDDECLQGDCPDQVECPILANEHLGVFLQRINDKWREQREEFEAEERELHAQFDADEERRRTTWAPVDGAAILAAGLPTPRTEYFTRTDGVALLYPGRTHSFIGESENGKSLAAYLANAQILNNGGGVVYVDFEGEATDFYRWMLALGVPAERLVERARYISPMAGIDDVGRRAIRRACMAVEPSIITFDGVTEAMMLHDLNDNAGVDTAQFMNMFSREFERVGVTVILIDHTPHGGNRAIGSQHKRSAVTGASYFFTKRGQLIEGRHCKVDIKILKDRPGQVRKQCVGGEKVGTLNIAPGDQPGRVDMHIEPVLGAVSESLQPVGDMERVSRWLEENPRATSSALQDGAGGDRDANKNAAGILVEQGYAEVEEQPYGPQIRRWFTSTKPFRAPGER